jgi:hypothetical protein
LHESFNIFTDCVNAPVLPENYIVAYFRKPIVARAALAVAAHPGIKLDEWEGMAQFCRRRLPIRDVQQSSNLPQAPCGVQETWVYALARSRKSRPHLGRHLNQNSPNEKNLSAHDNLKSLLSRSPHRQRSLEKLR